MRGSALGSKFKSVFSGVLMHEEDAQAALSVHWGVAGRAVLWSWHLIGALSRNCPDDKDKKVLPTKREQTWSLDFVLNCGILISVNPSHVVSCLFFCILGVFSCLWIHYILKQIMSRCWKDRVQGTSCLLWECQDQHVYPRHGHQPLAGQGRYLLACLLPAPLAVDKVANSLSQRNAFLLLILILGSASPPCCEIMVFGNGISKFTLKWLIIIVLEIALLKGNILWAPPKGTITVPGCQACPLSGVGGCVCTIPWREMCFSLGGYSYNKKSRNCSLERLQF